MRKWIFAIAVVLPLAVAGGLLYAKSLNGGPNPAQQINASGYVCPITGEEIPCPNCCPLNEN